MKFFFAVRNILILILFIISCRNMSNRADLNYYDLGGYTQGTTYRISYGSGEFINLQPGIDSILDAITNSLSVYDSSSIISKINRNDPDVVPDEYLFDVLEKSIHLMKISDGAFDITCSPLIDFWGFGPQQATLKDTAEIKNILKYVGVSNIKLIENKLIKSFPEVKINVNAIAQGYTVDVLSIFLEKNNIVNYLVEIGGELRTHGMNKEGQPWKIGIDKPIENNNSHDIQTILNISGQSVSTSGNYRNFYIENGMKYAHTINPKTGYPARNELLSVTIISKSCTEADALATACMVKGLSESKEMLKKFPGTEACFICQDKKKNIYTDLTPGFKSFIDSIE